MAKLKQEFALIPDNVKENYLVYALKNLVEKRQSTIIFTQTCRKCHFIAHFLMELDYDVAYLHSVMPQRKRLAMLAKFKQGHSRILIATDVASRGLDIPLVEWVFNFDIPKNPKDYVHRVGRTARAGRGGQSFSFVSQFDAKLLLAVEEYTNSKLDKVELPEKEVLEDMTSLAKQMQIVRVKMSENGMSDLFDDFKEQKKAQREAKEKASSK